MDQVRHFHTEHYCNRCRTVVFIDLECVLHEMDRTLINFECDEAKNCGVGKKNSSTAGDYDFTSCHLYKWVTSTWQAMP
jgi:hypothetical protein